MNTTANQNTKPVPPATTEVKIKTLAELENEYSVAKENLEKNDFADEDVKKVKSAKAAIEKFNADKQANITNIKKTIDGFGFTLTDIYTVKELNKAGFAKTDSPIQEADNTDTPKVERLSKSSFDLIHIKGVGMGDPGFKLKKGRIYEGATSKNKKPYALIPSQLAEFGVSLEKLKTKIADNENAKNYITTEEGKKELEEIVKVVKEAKEKADAKAKKATTA